MTARTDASTSEAVLRRVADQDEVARASAEEIARAAAQSIAERGSFTLVLTGGSTPRRLYQLLADPGEPYRARVPWERIHVFFGDERHVPPDHPDSNFGMARDALLAHVRPASIHRMPGEEHDADAAADGYQAELEAFFGARADRDPPPRFDLVLLGLGHDAHAASLFPGNPALEERRRWVVAPFVEQVKAHRISLTFPILNRSRGVLFLVSGAARAEAMEKVFAPAPGTVPPPAARVRPDDGTLLWIADRVAASRVPQEP